jgi:hypothetical protein
MAAAIPPEASGLAHDLGSAAVTAGVALALLRFFEELAKRGVFEQVSHRRLFASPFPPLARHWRLLVAKYLQLRCMLP